MDERTNAAAIGIRLRVDLPGPVTEALHRRAIREDRTMPAEAAHIIRTVLERDGDLLSRAGPVAEPSR